MSKKIKFEQKWKRVATIEKAKLNSAKSLKKCDVKIEISTPFT